MSRQLSARDTEQARAADFDNFFPCDRRGTKMVRNSERAKAGKGDCNMMRTQLCNAYRAIDDIQQIIGVCRFGSNLVTVSVEIGVSSADQQIVVGAYHKDNTAPVVGEDE